MAGKPITYFDRYRKSFVDEQVYGEGALRFAYETVAGRCLSRWLFARAFVSRIFGWYMSRPASRSRIRPFIDAYGLDEQEFSGPEDAYRSFNEFFCRELKPGSRPVDSDPRSVVFPADGRHFGWQEIGAEEGVFVKGQRWNLEELLDHQEDLVRRFSGGTLVLSRLCPVDYHHFHYPVGGRISGTRRIRGPLFSVSPIALRQRLAYLWTNKRCLTLIDTADAGTCCFIEVGATNVGSIHHRPLPLDGRVDKGAPKGWFEFGGSSVVTLFEPGRVTLCEDLLKMTRRGYELYARAGDRMGACPNH